MSKNKTIKRTVQVSDIIYKIAEKELGYEFTDQIGIKATAKVMSTLTKAFNIGFETGYLMNK